MQNESDATIQKTGEDVGGRLHYGILILVVGVFTIFGSIGLGRFAIGMIIPAMASGLHLSNSQLGMIVSGTFLGYLVSTAVSGALSVRYGPRRVITVSLLLITTGMIAAARVSSFWAALVCQLLIGTGSGGSNVPAMGLVSRWYAERLRGTASGLAIMGSGFGFALAGTLVPYLLGLYGSDGWRMSWLYLGVLVFLIALLSASALRNSPDEMGLKPIGWAEEENRATASSVGSAIARSSQRDLYLSKPLWGLGIVYFLFGFSYVNFTTYLAKYVIADIGFAQASAGRLWSAVGIVSIASGFLWGMVSDRIGRKRALFAAYALQGLCLLMLALLQQPAMIVLTSLLYALTLWSIPSIVAATCADYVGGRLAPSALGMITILFGIGQVISPSISGFTIDATHSFTVPFLLSGAASAGGAALILRVLKKPAKFIDTAVTA